MGKTKMSPLITSFLVNVIAFVVYHWCQVVSMVYRVTNTVQTYYKGYVYQLIVVDLRGQAPLEGITRGRNVPARVIKPSDLALSTSWLR